VTVSNSQSVSFNCGPGTLLDQVADLLETDWRARRIVRSATSVSGRTRPSWRSWGDDINVVITKQKGPSVTVKISSETVWKTTQADFGKSKSNVDKLSAQLAERLSSPAAQATP
jgi:hypothetical protein